MTQLEDLLSPLEAERIKSVFSPDRVKVRSLSTSFFRFSIPLSTTSSSSSYKALQIEPVASSAQKILVGLLWHAMFGRKLKIVHWFILFQVFSKTINDNAQSRTILAILMIITSKDGRSWNTNLDPVMRVVRRKSRKDPELIVQELLKDLPFRLPKKAPKIDDLFRIREVSVSMQRPKDSNRIGVGYKDKGSLNSGSKIEPLPPDLFLEREDIFDRLLRQIESKYQKFIT